MSVIDNILSMRRYPDVASKWKPKGGKVILIKEMTDSHLLNALNNAATRCEGLCRAIQSPMVRGVYNECVRRGLFSPVAFTFHEEHEALEWQAEMQQLHAEDDFWPEAEDWQNKGD